MTKNEMNVIGFVGSDPEVFHTQGGRTGARFSVATKEVWKGKDGNRHERTEWHRVVMWGRLGEIAGKLVKKGSHVHVSGPLRSSEYTDKAGAKQRSWDIVADELLLLDRAEKRSEEDREPGADDPTLT